MRKARSRRAPRGSAAAKTFITIATLAGTLGGWAKLTVDGAAEADLQPSPSPVLLKLPPLPTVVPPPAMVDLPQPTQDASQATLRRVDAPLSSPSSGSGRASAVTRSSR